MRDEPPSRLDTLFNASLTLLLNSIRNSRSFGYSSNTWLTVSYTPHPETKFLSVRG
ncbi:unnamed protein product [Penicillium roqueforti FM164]|uniref:Genomic scaffold, ProqFM164S01 n=1 Tax=Penicillium roqueforti (strain FM164) TaxID=1365484 RepID=W6PWF8_PENRF|nr:unnamed protein product [Penicillium roqueforti FM164]